jgi:hypothetical protein
MRIRAVVRPLAGGGYRLRLGADEREAIRTLCTELRERIAEQDESVARLFPAAYRDDPAASAEYDQLVRESLVGGRLAALDTVAATVDAERLTEEELGAWCGTLNDARLVLGERLGVTEDMYEDGIDPADPRAPGLAYYAWLTWLQSQVVDALATRL